MTFFYAHHRLQPSNSIQSNTKKKSLSQPAGNKYPVDQGGLLLCVPFSKIPVRWRRPESFQNNYRTWNHAAITAMLTPEPGGGGEGGRGNKSPTKTRATVEHKSYVTDWRKKRKKKKRKKIATRKENERRGGIRGRTSLTRRKKKNFLKSSRGGLSGSLYLIQLPPLALHHLRPPAPSHLQRSLIRTVLRNTFIFLMNFFRYTFKDKKKLKTTSPTPPSVVPCHRRRRKNKKKRKEVLLLLFQRSPQTNVCERSQTHNSVKYAV